MAIVIITGPVQSGKTTWLMNWAHGRTDVAGFLCPDIYGRRHFLHLNSGTTIPFEVDEATLNKVINIGRFSFLKSTFAIAKRWLSGAVITGKKWIVIDEIGKLEMNDTGFEPELSGFLERMKSVDETVVLILVVRDTLIGKVCQKYNLENTTIIHIQQLSCGKTDFLG